MKIIFSHHIWYFIPMFSFISMVTYVFLLVFHQPYTFTVLQCGDMCLLIGVSLRQPCTFTVLQCGDMCLLVGVSLHQIFTFPVQNFKLTDLWLYSGSSSDPLLCPPQVVPIFLYNSSLISGVGEIYHRGRLVILKSHGVAKCNPEVSPPNYASVTSV